MPEPSPTRRIWSAGWRWLALGLCLLPPALLAFLLRRNAVNVPYWDDWDDDIAGLFVKAADGQLSFGDFWAQHNESRFVLLRLIYLLLGKLTHWNLGYEIAFTFLLACAVAGAVFWLGKKAFASQPAVRWAVFFLSSLLIFSPAQYETWLWGIDVVRYLPLFCIFMSLLLLQTATGDRTKIILCAGLAMISTYSFSNGLLVWVVLFPVLFLTEGWDGCRRKSRAALGWVLGLVANAALYFQDYRFPPSSGFWHLLLSRPWLAAEYLFAFLGSPLADHNADHAVEIAALIGGSLLLAFAVAGVLCFRWRKNPALAHAVWPWLTLGGYGLLSALLATSGRAALGLEQSLAPRYAMYGICLLVALVHLLPLLALHRPWKTARPTTARIAVTLTALGAVVILLHALAFPSAVVNMSVFRLSLLHAKSCLKFIDVVPPQPAVKACLYHTPDKLKSMADALEKRRVLDYSLLPSARLADFKVNSPSPGQNAGMIENCQVAGTNVLLAGWAFAAGKKAPADCVVFTYEGAGVEPIIFALMDQRIVRADLVQKNRNPSYLLAGWEKTIRLPDLPKGVLVIKAWAYDVTDDSLTPLENTAQLDNK